MKLKIKKKHAKRLFSFFVFIGIIAILIVFGYVSFLKWYRNDIKYQSLNDSDTDFAQAFILKGGPRVEKLNIQSKTIANGENLTSGDTLNTDGSAQALLIFPNNSLYIIDSNTTVKILDEQNGNVFLESGKIYSILLSQNTPSTIESLRYKLSSLNAKVVLENLNGQNKIYVKNGSAIVKFSEDIQLKETQVINFKDTEAVSINLETSKSKINFETFNADTNDWNRLISCIEMKYNNAIESKASVKNFIKNKGKDFVICLTEIKEAQLNKLADEALIAAKSAREKEISQQEEKDKPKITAISDNTNLATTDKMTCNWSATGKNIESYEYSVGTTAGTDNTVVWTLTSNTNVTLNDIGMEYGVKYFCNVRVKSGTYTSNIKSSDGVIFDESQVSMSTPTDPPGVISGSATYTDLADGGDLQVRIYVRRENAGVTEYSNGSSWGTSIFWHNASVTDAAGNISWTVPTTFSGTPDEYTDAQVFVEIKNTKTGKIFQNLF